MFCDRSSRSLTCTRVRALLDRCKGRVKSTLNCYQIYNKTINPYECESLLPISLNSTLVPNKDGFFRPRKLSDPFFMTCKDCDLTRSDSHQRDFMISWFDDFSVSAADWEFETDNWFRNTEEEKMATHLNLPLTPPTETGKHTHTLKLLLGHTPSVLLNIIFHR